jgi:hypothetical protein
VACEEAAAAAGLVGKASRLETEGTAVDSSGWLVGALGAVTEAAAAADAEANSWEAKSDDDVGTTPGADTEVGKLGMPTGVTFCWSNCDTGKSKATEMRNNRCY